jgi:hypothetical protein
MLPTEKSFGTKLVYKSIVRLVRSTPITVTLLSYILYSVYTIARRFFSSTSSDPHFLDLHISHFCGYVVTCVTSKKATRYSYLYWYEPVTSLCFVPYESLETNYNNMLIQFLACIGITLAYTKACWIFYLDSFLFFLFNVSILVPGE